MMKATTKLASLLPLLGLIATAHGAPVGLDDWVETGRDADNSFAGNGTAGFTETFGTDSDSYNDSGAIANFVSEVTLDANNNVLQFSLTVGNITATGPGSNNVFRVGFENDASPSADATIHYNFGYGDPGTRLDARFAGASGSANEYSQGTAFDNTTLGGATALDTGNISNITVTLTYLGDAGGGLHNYQASIDWDGQIHTSSTFTRNTATWDKVYVNTNSGNVNVAGDTYTVSNVQVSLPSSMAGELVPLAAQVDSLPQGTPAEAVKKAVLELALERANNAYDVSLDAEAEALADDIADALTKPAAGFITPNPSAANLSVLRPLTVVENNPYLDDLVANATDDLSSADAVWPRATEADRTLDGLGGTYGFRTAPQTMRTYFWLFAHEQSPMRFDPELLKRLLRRAHAFVDALYLDPDGTESGYTWTDQFSISAGFPGLFEILELHPGLLLPSEMARWENVLQVIRANMLNYTGPWGMMRPDYDPWNYNIETARILGVLNVALYFDDQVLLDRIARHVRIVISRMRPDGAVPYHGQGNPSVNYHDELLYTWLEIYEQTGQAEILGALQKSQWKAATMGRTDEFWTSPHYKAFRWNFTRGCEIGPEAAAHLSGNPYMRFLLDRKIAWGDLAEGRNRHDVAWYDGNINALSLPEHYTIPDRNVNGPRSWNGTFCYAGAFKPNPPGMEGRETLMGAMTVDAADGRLNSILADVTPRIWMTEEDYLNGSGQTISAWGKLTVDENAATTITRDYSVSSSIHGITAVRGGAYQGPVSDFNGRQLWLGLPDRIVGLISVTPKVNNAQAYAVNSVVRLISGGTAGAEVTKTLQTIASGHYRYGELDIIIHDHNFTSLQAFEVPYRLTQYPATEITFSDRASEPAPAGSLQTYPLGAHYDFVVEVRPTWAPALSSTAILGDREILGLEVVAADRAFQVWLNADSTNRLVTLQRDRLPAGTASYAVSNGVLGTSAFSGTIPASVTLSPGQHAFIVVSADPRDHGNGWKSFEDFHYSSIAPPDLVLEAEDWDAMSGVQTESTTDDGGGLNVGWIDAGDWLDYEVTLNPGVYSIEYRVASLSEGVRFDLKEGTEVLGSIDAPATGAWQNWITVRHEVPLGAGTHTLRIAATGTGWNINWLRFSRLGDLPPGRSSSPLALANWVETGGDADNTFAGNGTAGFTQTFGTDSDGRSDSGGRADFLSDVTFHQPLDALEFSLTVDNITASDGFGSSNAFRLGFENDDSGTAVDATIHYVFGYGDPGNRRDFRFGGSTGSSNEFAQGTSFDATSNIGPAAAPLDTGTTANITATLTYLGEAGGGLHNYQATVSWDGQTHTSGIFTRNTNTWDKVYVLTNSGLISVPNDTYTVSDAQVTRLSSPTDYDDWGGPSGFNLSGGPNDDDDGDGRTNYEEYVFGLDPTSGSSCSPIVAPLSGTTGLFQYTRRNPMLHDTGLTYSYQYSTTLAPGSWMSFTPEVDPPATDDGDPVETVTVNLPDALMANPRLFVRIAAQ